MQNEQRIDQFNPPGLIPNHTMKKKTCVEIAGVWKKRSDDGSGNPHLNVTVKCVHFFDDNDKRVVFFRHLD